MKTHDVFSNDNEIRRLYNRSVTYIAVLPLIGMLMATTSPVQDSVNTASSELNEILSRMASHEEWQNRHLIQYQVHRKFYAENPRFKKQAALEVKTSFRRPTTFESEVIRSEGSKMIRERVFDKILEAEVQANTELTRQEISITPANYAFALLGKQDCTGRPCYQLRINPKQRNNYSIAGHIWVDAEDGAIVRIQGSPAKRRSFWTLSTEIERRYKRIDGVWLCDVMESTSDIFMGGRSTLKIEYNYLSVQTESNIAH